MGMSKKPGKSVSKRVNAQSFFALMALFCAAGVLLVNVIFSMLGERYPLRLDLTLNKAYQLDESTNAYLQALDQPVTIQLLAKESTFVNTSAYNAQANEVLKLLAMGSGQVTLEYVDYLKNPTFAANYPELSIKHGDILVSSGDAYKLVPTENLFNYNVTPTGALSIASSKAEEALLSAMVGVTSKTAVSVSLLTGHSAYETKALEALLQNNNYTITEQNLVTQDIDPAATMAFLLAPATDLNAQELKRLDAFLYNNGQYGKTLVYCANAAQMPLPNLESFLQEWGVTTGAGGVFETDASRVFNYQPFFPIVDVVDDTFAQLLADKARPILMPMARPLEVVYQYRDNTSTTVLLEFGKSTGVRPPDAPEDFVAADATQKGPMPAMVLSNKVLVDRTTGAETGRSNVLVCSSVAMLDTNVLENPALMNGEYVLKVFETLSGQEATVHVQPKTLTAQGLNLNKAKADAIGTVFVFGLPGFILLMGAFVWLKRRHD